MSDAPLTPRPPHDEASLMAALEQMRACVARAEERITDDGLVTHEEDRRRIADDMMLSIDLARRVLALVHKETS